MSNVIISEKVGDFPCPICFGEFADGERKWTHEGGENHEPFHSKCLKEWFKTSLTCPLDRRSINPDNPFFPPTI